MAVLPNWSPVVDFITTDEFSAWNQERGANGSKMQSWNNLDLRKPDRIFATSGRGRKGAISEFRYGLAANVGLDLEYGAEATHVWLFPPVHAGATRGFHLLLSMPGHSTLLHLAEDLSQARETKPAESPYDLSSSTLALMHSDRLVIQVSRTSVVLVTREQR
jgi:hypothetical protein